MASVQLAFVETSVIGDQVILQAGRLNVDGNVDDDLLLPAGFGSVCPLQVAYYGGQIATKAVLVDFAMWCGLYHTTGGTRPAGDLGAGRIWDLGSYVHAMVAPEHPLIWNQGDVVRVLMPEVDVNASPTLDITYRVRVLRLRTT